MATFTGSYEFRYTTPTPGVDDEGNPVPLQVPTTFVLGSISEDVARGIRFGLKRVASITNVVVARVMEDREAVTTDPTA